MGLLEVKNSENLDFQVVFLKKKTEECNLKVLNGGITTPCSAMKITEEWSCLAQIYFYIFCRTTCGRFQFIVLLKVATKSFIVL